MAHNIDPFVRLVREYVAAIDGAGESGLELLRTCAQLLPRIYAAGLDLPDVEPTDDDSVAPLISPGERLAALLGPSDYYLEVFDPYVDEEPVAGSLADDLADIYLDLARPLWAFDSGRVSEAVGSWKLNLSGHCGDHLVSAMRTIHWLVNHHAGPDFGGLADEDR